MYIAHCHKVSDAMSTLVSREKPGFQALSKGLIILLCAEVVRQGVPDDIMAPIECKLATHEIFKKVTSEVENTKLCKR